MDGARGIRRRDEKSIQNVVAILKGRGHSEDLGVDGRMHYNECQGNRVGICGLDSCGLG